MIIVDSNKQLIEINSDFINLRTTAEERTELYHFCSLNSLKKIITSKSLRLNNLNNFINNDDYEKRGIGKEFLGLVFISCLTHSKKNKNLWCEFGDDGRGAKLTFKYSGVFHDELFDKNRMIEAYSKDDDLICKFGFSVSNTKAKQLTTSPNFSTNIITELILSDVKYSNLEPQSTVDINNENYLNLSNVSRIVLQKYADEFETRVIGILRSVKGTTIEDISYLLVPLNLDKYPLNIEYGRKVSKNEKDNIQNML